MVGYRDDHYVLHEHILEHRYPHYINQQSLSLPSHTLTGFPQWLIHITCLKFGLVAFILAGSTHTTYCKTLQNALGMNARENVSRIYVHAYIRLVLHHPLCFSILCSQAAQLRGTMPWSVKWTTTKLVVRTQYILHTKCCAPAIVMHWQLTSHLPNLSALQDN